MLQSVVSAIQNTVPISKFNPGLAGKIFADVKLNGPKVVMKNNEAEVVLLLPNQYVQLMDMLPMTLDVLHQFHWEDSKRTFNIQNRRIC